MRFIDWNLSTRFNLIFYKYTNQATPHIRSIFFFLFKRVWFPWYKPSDERIQNTKVIFKVSVYFFKWKLNLNKKLFFPPMVRVGLDSNRTKQMFQQNRCELMNKHKSTSRTGQKHVFALDEIVFKVFSGFKSLIRLIATMQIIKFRWVSVGFGLEKVDARLLFFSSFHL